MTDVRRKNGPRVASGAADAPIRMGRDETAPIPSNGVDIGRAWPLAQC